MTNKEAIECIEAIHVQMFNSGNSKWTKACDMAIEALNRPHGKWITTSNPNHSPFDNTNEFICICSKCTYSSGDRITAYWNFCPNCGEPMEVEEGEVK